MFLTRTPVLIFLFLAMLAIGYSFSGVRAAVDGPILDMLMTGEAAQARLAELNAEQRRAHFWATILNDTAYPLAYGGLLAGLALRFGGKTLAIPAAGAALTDLAENTVQALALSGTADLLVAKTVLTPLKFGLFALAAVIALGLLLRSGWRALQSR
ncbi:MAG: hypothetical protein AAFZ91_13390 [Pseudomonadota bacterium]